MKPLNFGQYQQMKRFTFNQMNAWAVSVYKSGFEDGQEDGTETVILDFDEKTMREFLTSIKGISDKTAGKIISAMIEKGGGDMGGIKGNRCFFQTCLKIRRTLKYKRYLKERNRGGADGLGK